MRATTFLNTFDPAALGVLASRQRDEDAARAGQISNFRKYASPRLVIAPKPKFRPKTGQIRC